jgi:hypothetical protein
MAEPTEMNKPMPAANVIELNCPYCEKPWNPFLRLFPTAIKGTHLAVFGCAVCKNAINGALVPTQLLTSSGLVGIDGQPMV